MGTPADSRRQSMFESVGLLDGTANIGGMTAQKMMVVKEGQVKEEREKGLNRAK